MAVRHGTLTANTAHEVSFTKDRNEVAVTHLGNVANPIYVRTDGTTAVVAANDNYVVLPGETKWIPRLPSAAAPFVVSLISAGAVDWSVELP